MIIKLYYTGSTVWKGSQTLASKSLGGYISNTAIPNGTLNSLFGSFCSSDFWGKNKISEYIGLGLYIYFFDNETEVPTENLSFTLKYNEDSDNQDIEDKFKDVFKFSIGLGPLSGNQDNGIYMEKIQGANSIPYYFTQDMQELEENTPLILNNVPTNGIGVWIKREFNPLSLNDLFGVQSDYWLTNDSLPNLDLNLDLNIQVVN